jgi:hypothetical protein
MAREIKVITQVTATDDITGMIYQAEENVSDVKRYRITIEEMDPDGTGVLNASYETRFVYEVDTHVKVMHVMREMLSGRLISMFAFLLTWYLGSDNARATSLLAYTRDASSEAVNAVIAAFGGSKKQAPKDNAKSSSAYTAHVREYAIAHNWKGANGLSVAGKGKLSQALVIKFETETGITREKFDNGERAVIHATENAK